jgi:hypothetical protein
MPDGANFRVWEDIHYNIPLYSWVLTTEIVRSATPAPVDDAVGDAVYGAVVRTHHDTDHQGLNEFLRKVEP